MRAHGLDHDHDELVAGASGSAKPPEQRRRELGLAVATAGILGIATIAAVATADEPSVLAGTEGTVVAADEGPADSAFVDFVDADLDPEPADGDIDADADADAESDDDASRADGGCVIGADSVRQGSSGDGVACLQRALTVAGVYDGPADGDFDRAIHEAVVEFQEREHLFVDGVVGRESAVVLDVWPDEDSLVTRTPRPAPGATDLWGVELSPVASAGDDAPPLPEGSGSGYRVVYEKAGQRVWAVDGDERIIRSWLVSGSTTANELPGTHTVYSRSERSTAWNGKAYLPYMIRWLKTERGNIGFHGIPTKVSTGEVYQTTDQLGERLSGGCQRQHDTDAAFLWGFADVGTSVVVI
ncbi:L,D-transpeptidase family protein [Ilumatobacter sp.]|uniref:L,D-transpeptidase family protein n=1 Tax=Ilumatobacter sp. TaxID=1967498 RepID=UPI003B52133C